MKCNDTIALLCYTDSAYMTLCNVLYMFCFSLWNKVFHFAVMVVLENDYCDICKNMFTKLTDAKSKMNL